MSLPAWLRMPAALVVLAAAFAQAQPEGPANLARSARASASSSRPEYPLNQVNDGDMGSSWSTAMGQVKDQWLRLDWDAPQTMCGIVMYSTGPWTQTVEAQVEVGGRWLTVGTSGSVSRKAPLVMVFSFQSVTTKSLRFLFDGGAAFFEVEAYGDPAKTEQVLREHVRPRIVVAGDLRGHLIGTLSEDAGSKGIEGANVTVTGSGHKGPWSSSAKTDSNGWFQADLPFGATGNIHVEAAEALPKAGATVLRLENVPSAAGQLADLDVNAVDISTILTPRPLKQRTSLDGVWEWVALPRAAALATWNSPPPQAVGGIWHKVKVPAHWEMEGLVAESGRALYRRQFELPAGWKGKRIKLRAEAVYSRCQVWVNGDNVGGHEGGATPFELDLTDAAKPGASNEVLVQVDARSKASDLDNASVFAYFELAGIWQPIEVFAVDPTHISHLAARTTYDKNYRNAELSVEVDAVAEGVAGKHEIAFRLIDPAGREVPTNLRATVDLRDWSRQTLQLRAAVRNPVPWNAEAPRLYKLIGFVDGKKVLEQPVGFRQIEIKDRAVTLNGTPIKIRGISKLDCHPLTGRALTPEIERLDNELIKGANFNAVRATIFPPHAIALDLADKTGLYYENEGPTCWGNHADDLRYAPIYAGIMCQYLERDRNHPCVIDWSICNESDYGRVFSLTQKLMKAIDPTRLYSATWGNDTLDVDTYHHPVNLSRIQNSLENPKPAFFDECLGLFHGWEDLALWLDLDPGMKDYWVVGIADILRAINAGRNQLGTIQFCWSDDTSLVPGKGADVWRHEQPPIRYTESIYKLPKRGMVGDVVWGTVDGWRRPRPEYWLSKKLYSPVQIEEKPLDIPHSGPIQVPVENFNQFVDLNRYVCKWTLGSAHGQARAECKPMGKGTLAIPAKPGINDFLGLEFFDEQGRKVDAYRIPFKPHELPAWPSSGKAARIQNQGGYLDNAAAVRLVGKDCELAYDQTSAALLRCLKAGEVILNAGPNLRLLKTTEPTELYPAASAIEKGVNATPDPTAWRLASATTRKEGSQAVLDWKGSYGKDLIGGYEIRMDDAGDVEIRYRFTYNGPPIAVREVALEFALPLTCDRLEWDRNAEYSVYPPDHIGRPHGTAIPHPVVPQTVPPGKRPFGLDDHPWGCNDFRSTKRNVFWATLTNSRGEGLKVISDGTQHVRATVGVHDIFLKVMDWYGGEGSTYAWGFHYGDGKHIATGDVLKGVVRLQLLGGAK